MKTYNREGSDVRANDIDDKIFVATRDFWISSRISLQKGDLVRFNGKNIVFRPSGIPSESDQETNSITSVEYALRRKWLTPHKSSNVSAVNQIKNWFSKLQLPHLIGRVKKDHELE